MWESRLYGNGELTITVLMGTTFLWGVEDPLLVD